MAYPYSTPGINPDAPDPLGSRGLPGQNDPLTNLPDFIANNPDAYLKLLQMRRYDPLETAAAFANLKGEVGPLGSSNGLVVYRRAKPEYKKAALAGAVAAYANARQMEQLRAILERREPTPNVLGQAVGGLGGMIGGPSAPDPSVYQGWGGVTGGGANPAGIPAGAGPGGWRQAVGGLLGKAGGVLGGLF